MSNRRLNAPTAAQVTRTELARAGKLGVTVTVGEVPAAPTPRRRMPSMPRITIDNQPTPERTSKAPEGIEAATGTKAHRIRNPLDVHKQHFAPDLIAAATHWLKLRESVETASRVTAGYEGPSGKQGATPADQRGGVADKRRADAAELAYIEAVIEEEFHDIMDLIAAGVDAHRHNQPKTVADIARRCLAYRSKDGQNETAAGVGMVWGWLVRLKGIQIQIRATRRTFSTQEEIAMRIQERRRQAATAQAQFHRERDGRDDEAS